MTKIHKQALQAEVESLLAHGMEQVTVREFYRLYDAAGFRFDADCTVRQFARYLSGPRAGELSPCAAMYPVHKESGLGRVFDELCSHAVENGEGPVMPQKLKDSWRKGEGWKTNDNYKVNKKLIFPYGISFSYGSFNTYGDRGTIYSDIDRILCVLDGQPFDKCYTVGYALDRASRGAKTGGTFESEYFEGRFYKKGTVHLKWKREDLWEKFNTTAAAGKKWLGEDTQQYRPKKRKTGADIPWQCRDEHNFIGGVCERCGEPEVDELEAVECDYCRAIFEHTGVKHCPIHALAGPALESGNTQMALEA